ncbi:CoxG family protein [Roseospirillum parvum]|uniref:Carbon monoxide dehydrogenase subunit G n=1 Tax=Roseospirillum parvum TaxID=83401 RepID=A0A1G7YNF1_9PROT|nr:carbon monoxide dehydrogenase subunit G [Roseospirillum parvum]SDG97836.1 hypothetical protein SAMN05421742_103353 [Roseospirillum parvum]
MSHPAPDPPETAENTAKAEVRGLAFSGNHLLPADRWAVWEALNDPAVLKACIAPAEKLTRPAPDRIEATVAVGLGPLKARFKGDLVLENVSPAERYTMRVKGKGGLFGRIAVLIHVDMSDAPMDDRMDGQVDGGPGTRLIWIASADLKGWLAAKGQKLLSATVERHVAGFFDDLLDHLPPRR